jgi:hypothetical protein
MSRIKKSIEDGVIEAAAWGIGWFVCMSVLSGWFVAGRWAAPHLGWDGNPDMFGLLSAITALWIYEHRNMEGKYDRLHEILDRRPTD